MYSYVDTLQIAGVNRIYTGFGVSLVTFEVPLNLLNLLFIKNTNILSFDTPDVYGCKYIFLLMARSLVVEQSIFIAG